MRKISKEVRCTACNHSSREAVAGQSGEKERAWTRLQGSGLRGNCDQNILYKKLFSIKKKPSLRSAWSVQNSLFMELG